MKTLFAVLSVFALLVCMAMPAESKASVATDTNWDNDVGLTHGFVASPSATSETTMILPSAGHLNEKDATYLPMYSATTLKVYWCGEDSKASRCKAVYHNYLYLHCISRDSHNSVDIWNVAPRQKPEAKA